MLDYDQKRYHKIITYPEAIHAEEIGGTAQTTDDSASGFSYLL